MQSVQAGHPIRQRNSTAPAYFGGEVEPGGYLVAWKGSPCDATWRAVVFGQAEFDRKFEFVNVSEWAEVHDAPYDVAPPPERSDAMHALFGKQPIGIMPGGSLSVRQTVSCGDKVVENEATITTPFPRPGHHPGIN